MRKLRLGEGLKSQRASPLESTSLAIATCEDVACRWSSKDLTLFKPPPFSPPPLETGLCIQQVLTKCSMVALTQQSGEPAKRGEVGVDLLMATHQGWGDPGTNWIPTLAGLWVSLGAPAHLFLRWIRWFPPQGLLQARRTLLLATALATVAAGAAGVGRWVGGGGRVPWGWGLALGDPISLVQLELFQGPYQSSQTWMEIHGPTSRPRREFSPLAPAGRGFRVQRGNGGMGWEGFLPRTSEGPQRLTESQVEVSSLLGAATKDQRLEIQAPRGTSKAEEVSKPPYSCEFWVQSPAPPTMSLGRWLMWRPRHACKILGQSWVHMIAVIREP